MDTIGFLFGAGAEINYGMPSGGKFALDIFRQDPTEAREKFREIRDDIDKTTRYASSWLPENFENNNIHVFGERVYDTLIRDTIGNNRGKIIERINEFDKIAEVSLSVIDEKLDISLNSCIKSELKRDVENISVNHILKYSDFFEAGDKLFTNRYFAILLEYYKREDILETNEKRELGEIIKAIFQLQLGAMSEDLSRKIEDNIFKKDELQLDIFDDLGGNLRVNYETAGIKGLELLAKDRSSMKGTHPIIEFSFEIIERIYSEVLDYKSLIDSNWHYLYNPHNEWAKFCRISTFLYTVQMYIKKQAENLDESRDGYYDDLKFSDIKTSVIGTTNYNSFIKDRTGKDVIFLNGGVDEFYDPYVNAVGSEKGLSKEETHFIVPLLFTQSGTKPMTSIDMSAKYVEYYNILKKSSAICSIGFGFNYDDEHINGIIRTLIDREDKKLYIVDILEERDERKKRIEYARKLKVLNSSNIHFITVNKETRKCNDKLWIEILQEKISKKA
ncbi:hypothetical protein P7H42_06820 [Vagococcus lutrae]|uniref:hypothetical protein n=1 Tax=Vagococcus lutrae TaxID=81947 RepID=UPI002096B15C|nr:hypothetical protein [Vagococcus lutrae]MCO7151494.1 hypothetical protein [Vagococcus lutrae]MDT2812501.1 hypothetical protein [Vagococcus lutrae]MDT2819469.1 hypothetical protein [Vagococcus lutrae]MDT2844322.1 hypothetical protein [Vagococcus lutrae]WCG04357.1 hypothetical protein PML89_05015 [Vagococcus lutrae]